MHGVLANQPGVELMKADTPSQNICPDLTLNIKTHCLNNMTHYERVSSANIQLLRLPKSWHNILPVCHIGTRANASHAVASYIYLRSSIRFAQVRSEETPKGSVIMKTLGNCARPASENIALQSHPKLAASSV